MPKEKAIKDIARDIIKTHINNKPQTEFNTYHKETELLKTIIRILAMLEKA